MTPDEKQILLREIPKYIKENCYYTDGSIKSDDLWLVGWVAAEFHNPRNAMKVLIRNEYGLLGNLLNKLARAPDDSITRLIERTDSEVLLKAINRSGTAVLRRNELTYDPYAMKLLIAHDTKYLKYVDAELFKSKPFLLSVVGHCPEILPKAFPQVFMDHDFVFSLVQKNCACLKYLPREFRSDYKLCLEAVRKEGFSLMYIDYNLRDSDEMVLAAVSNRGNALSLASAQQKKDRAIVYAAVENCGLALDYVDKSWKGNFDLVSRAVANRGMALQYAAPELQDCDEIVMIESESSLSAAWG